MNIPLTNIYARQCKYCKKQFEANHGNRAFCIPPSKTEKQFGAKDCKITYNNLIAKGHRDMVKAINNQTLKNLKILEYFFSRGMFIVNGNQLLSMGFVPERITGRSQNSKGEYTIPEYYHFILINQGNNKFLIQKK